MSEKYKILVNNIIHTLVGAFTTYGERSRMKVLILWSKFIISNIKNNKF